MARGAPRVRKAQSHHSKKSWELAVITGRQHGRVSGRLRGLQVRAVRCCLCEALLTLLGLCFHDHTHLRLASEHCPRIVLSYQVYWSSWGTLIGLTLSLNVRFVCLSVLTLRSPGATRDWFVQHLLACEVVQGTMSLCSDFFLAAWLSKRILNQAVKYHACWETVHLAKAIFGKRSEEKPLSKYIGWPLKTSMKVHLENLETPWLFSLKRLHPPIRLEVNTSCQGSRPRGKKEREMIPLLQIPNICRSVTW